MPYQAPRIPIGARRDRVTIQTPVLTDDGAGGQTTTWETFGEPWARVVALDERTKEALAARQITAQHAYHVKIPYRTDLNPQMRLVYRLETLEIQSIADDEQRGRRLVLLCTEVQ